MLNQNFTSLWVFLTAGGALLDGTHGALIGLTIASGITSAICWLL